MRQGLTIGVIAGCAALGGLVSDPAAARQGSWTPQASPSPPPPPVYVAPPPPPPRPTKARPATPIGNPGGWVTAEDYPAESVRHGEEGTTAFRLMIDPGGKVTDCSITGSSGHPLLDEAACRLMSERGTFNPALDAKGKPTAGSWASRFRWVIPEPRTIQSPKPYTEVMTFIVEPDGSASACTMTGAGPGARDEKGPCGYGKVFEPYVDEAGNPVRRKVTLNVSVTVTDPDAPPPPAAPPPAPPPVRKKRAKP